MSLDRAGAERILADVKQNLARLDACPWHNFVPLNPSLTLSARYRCKHCSGVVDAHAYRWYMRGLADATRSVA